MQFALNGIKRFFLLSTAELCIIEAIFFREKGEKLEGFAALNKLFSDIYQDSDDTQQAMRKSFVSLIFSFLLSLSCNLLLTRLFPTLCF